MLRYKTRILITHAVDFLDKVDRVIVMKQGRILHQGHFDELKHLEYFRAILSNVKTKDNYESKEEKKQNFNLKDTSNPKQYMAKNEQDFQSETSDQSLAYKGSTINNDENKEKIRITLKSFAKLFFFSYWTAFALILALVSLYGKKQLSVQVDYYLLKWVKEVSKDKQYDHEKFKLIIYYQVYYISAHIISLIFEIVFALTIGIKLFRDMLKRLLFAPINLFFDVTPSGVILNRFSKDLRVVEIELTDILLSQVGGFIGIVIGVVLVALNFIWILIIVPIVIVSLIF